MEIWKGKGGKAVRARRNIGIMYAIALLQGMVFYGPIATLYREAAGVTIFQITLIESISMALGLLLELPWGAVADRIGYRRTMIFCCMLYLVSKVVFWRAEGFGMFLIERVLLSVVCAGLSGVEEAVLYLSADEGQSQRCFGIWNSLGQAGLMAAAVVYSVFVGENYRLAGLLTVLSYGLAAVLSLGIVEVRPEERRSSMHPVRDFGSALRGLVRTPGLLLLVLSMALLAETHQTITVFLCQKQYEMCGMRGAGYGAVYLLLTLAGMVGGLSQRCTRRLGEMRFGMLCALAAALASLTLALTRNLLLSVAAVLLLRLGWMLCAPLYVRLENERVAGENRATELSVNALLRDGVAVLTNLIFGRLAEQALGLAMGLGALLSLCAMALLAAFFKRTARS